jgi:hypothetical protein
MAVLEEQDIPLDDRPVLGVPVQSSDVPLYISAFFYEIFSKYPERVDEALWVSVDDPTRVSYSKEKPNGSYVRVKTTIGRWLKRVDPSLSDAEIKAYSERYRTLSTDVRGITLSVCKDADEIIRIYADGTVCDSCMVGYTAVAVYDSPDVEVVYATALGHVVGRAVCNARTKEFVRAYPSEDGSRLYEGVSASEWRALFLALLERNGYKHNPACLLGCRLRYIGGVLDEGCSVDTKLKMPCLDGDHKHVSWNSGDEFAVVTHGVDGTYECCIPNGFSEPRKGLTRPGYVMVGGEWHPDWNVFYSRFNKENIIAPCAHYSRYDNDYFWFGQLTKVHLFNATKSAGVPDVVHKINPTTVVIGLKHPIVTAELPKWLEAGFVVRRSGVYYHEASTNQTVGGIAYKNHD